MNKTGKKFIKMILFLIAFLCFSTLVHAESGEWEKSKDGYRYRISDDQYAQGITSIGKKKYYFNRDNFQRTGWRKIEGSYYYFKNVQGKNGYMIKDYTIDGIRLNKNGKAVINSRNKKRLKVLVKAAKIVDTCTTPFMSVSDKTRKVYQYVRDNCSVFKVKDYASEYSKDYPSLYADVLFSREGGDCYAYAAGLAFLMNAAGNHHVNFVHSGYHAWVQLKGYIYDVYWERQLEINCYKNSKSKSSTGGRPAWKGNDKFKRDIESSLYLR